MASSSAVSSFRDLLVWRKSIELVELSYELTSLLPTDERFGLVAQMRRAACSVPSNIAEGWGRDTKNDYLRFLQTARGSVFELYTQVEICKRLEYPGEWPSLQRQCDEIGRMLNGLMRSLRISSRTRKSEP